MGSLGGVPKTNKVVYNLGGGLSVHNIADSSKTIASGNTTLGTNADQSGVQTSVSNLGEFTKSYNSIKDRLVERISDASVPTGVTNQSDFVSTLATLIANEVDTLAQVLAAGNNAGQRTIAGVSGLILDDGTNAPALLHLTDDSTVLVKHPNDGGSASIRIERNGVPSRYLELRADTHPFINFTSNVTFKKDGSTGFFRIGSSNRAIEVFHRHINLGNNGGIGTLLKQGSVDGLFTIEDEVESFSVEVGASGNGIFTVRDTTGSSNAEVRTYSASNEEYGGIRGSSSAAGNLILLSTDGYVTIANPNGASSSFFDSENARLSLGADRSPVVELRKSVGTDFLSPGGGWANPGLSHGGGRMRLRQVRKIDLSDLSSDAVLDNVIPGGAILLAVTVKIQSAITTSGGTNTYDVGISGGDTDAFGSGIDGATNTESTDWTVNPMTLWSASDQSIEFTPPGAETFTGGDVWVNLFYITADVP